MSVVEGTSVTGPIKPIIMFARLAREYSPDAMQVDLSLVTTVRGRGGERVGNLLLSGAAEGGVRIDVLDERGAWDPRVMGQLCSLIEEHRPDIVETHQVKCHFILAQALLWRRVRKDFAWIAFHHGYTRASLKVRAYEFLDRWSLRRPDRVVTVCQPFADELVRKGAPADRTVVIPNAIEPLPPPAHAQLHDLRSKLGLSADDFVFLAVGRLSPEKGHRDLIQAFGKITSLAAPGRRPVLLVAGDGPERARLEASAGGLKEYVKFIGHQADVWPLYFLADVFVLPSHSEGSPLVLLEAMAAGCPVVATAVGGVPATVEHKVSALLVAPQDVEGLADALREAMQSHDLRELLRRGARIALRNFSPQAYRDQRLALYRGVPGGS